MTQRIIKFRAWDKIQEIMVPNDQVMRLEFGKNGVDWLGCWVVTTDSQGDPEQGLRQINKEDLELMQYTGLKDKNGKEIYEWDIVKDDEDNIYTVKWMEMSFDGYFGITGFGIDEYDTSFNKSDSVKCEIIGNIFENPELLK